MKINLGCGSNKMDGYTNVDIEPGVNPDLVADFRQRLPFDAEAAEEIVMLHTIEHVEKKHHEGIFEECHRVLAVGGKLILAYPEFVKCAENFINNYRGKRDFWEDTIFGRQLFPGDYHVCLMYTPQVITTLKSVGFVDIKHKPEPVDAWNSAIIATKGPKPPTYEQLLTKTVWG